MHSTAMQNKLSHSLKHVNIGSHKTQQKTQETRLPCFYLFTSALQKQTTREKQKSAKWMNIQIISFTSKL